MAFNLLFKCFLKIVFADKMLLILFQVEVRHSIDPKIMWVCGWVLKFFIWIFNFLLFPEFNIHNAGGFEINEQILQH